MIKNSLTPIPIENNQFRYGKRPPSNSNTDTKVSKLANNILQHDQRNTPSQSLSSRASQESLLTTVSGAIGSSRASSTEREEIKGKANPEKEYWDCSQQKYISKAELNERQISINPDDFN